MILGQLTEEAHHVLFWKLVRGVFNRRKKLICSSMSQMKWLQVLHNHILCAGSWQSNNGKVHPTAALWPQALGVSSIMTLKKTLDWTSSLTTFSLEVWSQAIRNYIRHLLAPILEAFWHCRIWEHVRVCHCCHVRPGVWKAVHYHRESKKQFYSQNVFLYRQWCHVSIKIQGALNHRALGEYSFCISIFFWRFNVFLRTCMEQWCPSASNVQLHRRVNKNHHCLPNLADTRERSNPYCDPSCSICRH